MVDVDLKTDLGNGLVLRNPIMNASGILGTTAALMKRVGRNGVGAVVTKTLGKVLNYGNPTPSIVEVPGVPYTILNSVMGNSPDWKEKKPELELLLNECEVPVIASVSGEDGHMDPGFIKEVADMGFAALEINMGKYVIDDTMKFVFISPYVSEHVEMVTKTIKSLVKIPVFIKLSANVPCIAIDAMAAERGGADGIIACNTVGPGMVIDIETGRPFLSSKEGFGGMSGVAVRPIVVRCVADIAKSVRIPIIGVGGIMNGRDVIEYMMAGASAVEIGTAAIYRGIGVYRKIRKEVEDFMIRKGHGSLNEIIGISQKYLELRESHTSSLLHSMRAEGD